jgi:hypothetical protein
LAYQVVGPSPATVFRRIEEERPTLLFDEAQSLGRRGSETSEVLREILCGGIGRNATVSRCRGQNHEVHDFPIYCPKAVALIGKLDGVLADRCLPVRMERKTAADQVARCRMAVVEKEGKVIHDGLEAWSADGGVRQAVAEAYAELEPFPIDNDRMAELLLPLQAVLTVLGETEALKELKTYADTVEELGRQGETQSTGAQLLAALRDIFTTSKATFLRTDSVISALLARDEEGWATCNRGQAITREMLANLLREYGIRSQKDTKAKGTPRGYVRCDFEAAWSRYVPPVPGSPSNPSNPSNPSGGGAGR